MASTRGSRWSAPPSRRAASTRMRRAAGPGSVDDAGDAVSVAEIGCVDHLLDPGRERALDRPALLIELMQQRRGEVGPTELDGELAGREEAARPLRGITQLGGPSQRSDGHVKSAAAARAPTRLLELQGDLFVRSGDQRRAVPDPTVGLGLQRLCERLVHTPALLHAGALAYR